MNTFWHSPDDVIEINGEQFDLEIFLEIEPEYSLPEGVVSRKYDGNKHLLYTKDNVSLGEMPWEDGERYINRVSDLNLMIQTMEDDMSEVICDYLGVESEEDITKENTEELLEVRNLLEMPSSDGGMGFTIDNSIHFEVLYNSIQMLADEIGE